MSLFRCFPEHGAIIALKMKGKKNLSLPSTSFLRFCAAFLVVAGLFCNVRPCAALPPNTRITLVAEVAGTTRANDAYWRSECPSIPANALFLVLKMGDVVDFFKPADAGTSYCDMLQAHNKHQWSPNGVDWVAVDFYSAHYGGSNGGWPRDKVEGDAREHLSFWGHEEARYPGGCCSTSTAVARTDERNWAAPLTPSS